MTEREILEDMEKEIYVHDLTVNHDDYFDFEDLMNLIKAWAKEKDYYQEFVKTDEKVTSTGQNKKYKILLQNKFSTVHHSVIDIDVKITGMTDEVVKMDNKNVKLNKGKVHVEFTGFLMTSMKARWETNAIFYFLRGIVDKFIYKINRPGIVGKVVSDTNNLADRIRGLLESYRYRINSEEKKVP